MTLYRPAIFTVVLLLGAALQGGCTSEGEENLRADTPPAAAEKASAEALTLKLLPEAPSSEETIQVVTPEAGIIDVTWFVNGAPVARGEVVLPASATARGDLVQVTGMVEGVAAQAEVRVENTPPRIETVGVESPAVHRGVDLVLVPEASDADFDPVEFQVRWFVNATELPDETELRLPGDRFSAGDLIRAQITPFDGRDEGKAIFIQDLVIPNAPPIFATEPTSAIEEGVFRYNIEVRDPDGDPLEVRLVEAPEGMALNPESREILWTVPAGLEGVFPVTIEAQDPRGAKSIQRFELTYELTQKE